jgi:predicted metal-dependent phosphoesterase TrpH
LIVDLHCHTAPSSSCAHDPPSAVLRQAREMGLDGLVITEHDLAHTDASLGSCLQELDGLALFRGVELSVEGPGDLFGHLVLIGGTLTEGPITDLKALASFVERERLALILAHPFRWRDGAERYAELLPVHAIEVQSVNVPHGRGCDQARDLAARLGLPMVAGSDAHTRDHVGVFATRLSRGVHSEMELAEEIRAGRVEPVAWNRTGRRWE